MNKDMMVYVPQIVIDVSDKLINGKTTSNERHNYSIRLEAIRDYCNMVLEQESKNPNKNIRKSDHKRSPNSIRKESQ
jgi:hypothetical protein